MSHEIIDQAKNLGILIQKSKEFNDFKISKQTMDEDEDLNNLKAKFDSCKEELNKEISKELSDKKKVKQLSDNLRSMYEQINDTEIVRVYESSKKALDELILNVNNIISESAYGRPEAASTSLCTGDCNTCGGCL